MDNKEKNIAYGTLSYKESYMLLVVWIVMGALFYSRQNRQFE